MDDCAKLTVSMGQNAHFLRHERKDYTDRTLENATLVLAGNMNECGLVTRRRALKVMHKAGNKSWRGYQPWCFCDHSIDSTFRVADKECRMQKIYRQSDDHRFTFFEPGSQKERQAGE